MYYFFIFSIASKGSSQLGMEIKAEFEMPAVQLIKKPNEQRLHLNELYKPSVFQADERVPSWVAVRRPPRQRRPCHHLVRAPAECSPAPGNTCSNHLRGI